MVSDLGRNLYGSGRLVVLDIETTGLSYQESHRIIEIAAIDLEYALSPDFASAPGEISDKIWHSYFNPNREVPAEATRIHGLTTEFLEDKPNFSKLAPDFLGFCKGARLIAHNGLGFDLPFINFELESAGLAAIERDSLFDTLIMARQKFPGKSNSLDALCRRFSVDASARTTHSAIVDCRLLAKVYVMLSGAEQLDITLKQEDRKIENLSSKKGAPFNRVQASDEQKQAHSSFTKKLADRWKTNFRWDADKK